MLLASIIDAPTLAAMDRQRWRALATFAVTVVAAVAMIGCGGDGPAGVCQLNLPGACVEQDGDEAAARYDCMQLNGTFEDDHVCPSEGRLGGCQLPPTTNVEGTHTDTMWFYAGADRDTEAEIREGCESQGGEYLPPQ